MRKFLVAGFGFLALALFAGDAEAGLFKKKCKICSKGGTTTTVTAGETKATEKAPAPSPQAVKNEDKKKAPAPSLKN